MSSIVSLQVADKFFLNRQSIAITAPPKPVDLPVNHIVVIDCSGSMYGDLPEIRSQLKNRLPSLLRDEDTISILWFSGRDQFGVLIEDYEVATAQDLSNLNKAIDRFLKPMGLTGFKQPLEESKAVIERITKKRPGGIFSLFFMSDGYDNQWRENEILSAMEAMSDQLASAAVVEYGWYANRPLLTKMAERVGGNMLFAENFMQYDPLFEGAMKRRIQGGKKVEVKLDDIPLYGLVYGMREGEILTFACPMDAKVLVPEGLDEIYYFTGAAFGKVERSIFDAVVGPWHPAMYAAVSMFSQRMLSNEVFKILKVLGDVRLVKQFTNCFGKQAYSNFQAEASTAVFDTKKRFVEGYDPNAVPREDAFTVVDLLHVLAEDEGNLFYPNHPLFEYKRTGRKAIQSSTVLNEAEADKLAEITAKLATTREPAKIKALQDEINAIVEKKDEGLVFEATDRDAGMPVSRLVFNEKRPNVSAQVTYAGTVKLPDNSHKKVPNPFPTKIVRNYTVIRDGIINVGVLPVTLTRDTWSKLIAEDVVSGEWSADHVFEIDLKAIPVINRKMVKEVSAKELFENEYKLTKLEAAQKVFKYFKDESVGKGASDDWKVMYGDEAAAWLDGLGFKGYGFSPKTVLSEATDFYLGKELTVSIKGLSSLPPVKDVIAKIDGKKKLTAREALLVPAIEEIREFFNSKVFKGSTNQASLLKVWIEDKAKEAIRQTRELRRTLSQIKFAIVVGQTWPKEFTSLDDNEMSLTVDGDEIACTLTMKEVEVKI